MIKKRNSFVFIALILVFALCMPLCLSNGSAQAFGGSSAAGMAVMEMSTKKVLHQKDMHRRMAMASTTKILTALVVLQNAPDLDKFITVPRQAAGIEGSSIYLKTGEEISIKSLLYGLMLRSGNDAAAALAIEVGGSVENFAKMMNETAQKCGALNSSFVTPHGLDHKEHYTTAYDLALISAYAMQNPMFKQICSSKTYTIPATNLSAARLIANKNKILHSLQGAVGVKTGFTKKAGRCFVSAAERDGMTIICVVLNCGPMFEESMNHTNAAFKDYKLFEVIRPYSVLGEVLIKDGAKETVSVYNEKSFIMLIKKGEEETFAVNYDYPTQLQAPCTAGDIVGKIQVFKKGELVFTDHIKVMESIKGTRTRDIIGEIIENFNA